MLKGLGSQRYIQRRVEAASTETMSLAPPQISHLTSDGSKGKKTTLLATL